VDGLAFVASVINSVLSWVTAAIIALFLFRRELAKVLVLLGERIEEFEGFGIKTKLRRDLDALEDILPRAADAKEAAAPAEAERTEIAAELTLLPPPYIILQSWRRLEQTVREAVTIHRPGTPRKPTRSFDYVSLARTHGLLTEEEMQAAHRLRQVRNLAAHSDGSGVTVSDALRYRDLADDLIQKIQERSAARRQ
jgi:hypothetical protein